MRTIKFRAWDKINKKMCSSIGTERTFYGGHLCLEITKARPDEDSLDNKSVALFNYELMQFTGLLDKNGKEIYEGDIVEWTIFPEGKKPTRIKDAVGFSNGCFKVEKRVELLGLKEPHRKLEVIGNIYENPELLKPSP